MSGFPTIPTRLAFGPKPQDTYKAGDPAKHGNAELFDLLFWQVAGSGGQAAGAWALLAWDGAALSLGASHEAWDPDGAFVPIVTRSGAGVYVVEYAATYPDKDGNAIATSIKAAKPFVQTTNDFRAVASVSSSRFITVNVRNSGGSAVDASVLVEARI